MRFEVDEETSDHLGLRSSATAPSLGHRICNLVRAAVPTRWRSDERGFSKLENADEDEVEAETATRPTGDLS